MNNEVIGYQATMHGDDSEEYLGLVFGEAPEYVLEHEFRRTDDRTLSELVQGELQP
jgi:hypothetical protein